ncbi:MAG: hypothetical protein ACLTXT_02500 [Ruminococcus callidus]
MKTRDCKSDHAAKYEIILEDEYIKTEVDANTNQWYSCSTNEKNLI